LGVMNGFFGKTDRRGIAVSYCRSVPVATPGPCIIRRNEVLEKCDKEGDGAVCQKMT